MGLISSKRTGMKMRVVWQDTAAKRRENARKASVNEKAKNSEVTDEKIRFPFPLY